MLIAPKNTHDLNDEIRPTVNMINSMFDEVYIVGGAVRDSILGRSTRDLDFAVPNDVEQIESILKSNPLLSVRADAKKFGTINAALGDFDLQVTQYRAEEYGSSSRKPTVTPMADIDGDLSRRDFTINAMALSEDEFIDPYNGIADIEKKIIRAVGKKEIKFREDPLRMLRAFRFVSTLGYDIEDLTLEAIKQNIDNILIVSSERIGEEFKKLLAGKYWADTLNELADIGMMSKVLDAFELIYKVTGDDTRHEFDQYSAAELEAMSIVERWHYLIRILDYAERASGVTSTDISATAVNFMNQAQVTKNVKAAVIQSFSKTVTVSNSDQTQDLTLTSLLEDIRALKAKNDPRAMIEEARYFTLQGRNDLREGKYISARKSYLQAIKITEDNFKFILSFNDEERKRASLRGITPYYINRVKYYFSAEILAENLHQKYSSTEKLSLHLAKNFKSIYISKTDVLGAIHSAISHVYRQNIHNSTLESYTAFLENPKIIISDEQRKRDVLYYIESEIRNPSVTPKEKSKLYLKKAKLAAGGKAEKDYGLDYYDPYIDYLYTSMLSQKSMANFNKFYTEFMDVIKRYIEITEKERKGWAGRRKRDLTSASSFVYALSLAESLDEKIKISKLIVRDYTNAGRAFEKNASRYLVLVEWFEFVNELLKTEFDKEKINSLILRIKKSQSFNYVDIDETYLTEYKPEIVQKRNLIRESLVLLRVLGTLNIDDKFTLTNDTLKSLVHLTKSKLLTPQDAFTLYKNFISDSENETIRTERIVLTDNELRNKQISEIEEFLTGESETIEYKSSWSFDLNKYRYTKVKENNSELQREVVKNIAGLMNKSGGVLFIGVEDDCSVCGLDETDFLMQSSKDPRKKTDNIIQDIGNVVKERLGRSVYARLSVDPIKYDDKTVIRIKIPSAIEPIIYREGDDEKYFVRSGTTTTNAGISAAIEKSKELIK